MAREKGMGSLQLGEEWAPKRRDLAPATIIAKRGVSSPFFASRDSKPKPHWAV